MLMNSDQPLSKNQIQISSSKISKIVKQIGLIPYLKSQLAKWSFTIPVACMCA
ncbi:hypothetical protein HDF23_001150 [Mucilaginibacter lappiensis]|uniref:Uncharacterized protein n=1 Tax=Mucilaginibacter lappiensis TaxID=354630 RepID=A0ABR6PF73_9SPHI|nr:hypothetical protein [Mucilaginibacter lappiensis]